jgi:hypothetical protein
VTALSIRVLQRYRTTLNFWDANSCHEEEICEKGARRREKEREGALAAARVLR